MLINLLREALDTRCLLGFDYDGKPRIVEPHALGLNKKGELALRAFQVGGEGEGWKLFILERAEVITVIIDDSQAPRPGYKTGDKQMVTILAELPAREDQAVAA